MDSAYIGKEKLSSPVAGLIVPRRGIEPAYHSCRSWPLSSVITVKCGMNSGLVTLNQWIIKVSGMYFCANGRNYSLAPTTTALIASATKASSAYAHRITITMPPVTPPLRSTALPVTGSSLSFPLTVCSVCARSPFVRVPLLRRLRDDQLQEGRSSCMDAT